MEDPLYASGEGDAPDLFRHVAAPTVTHFLADHEGLCRAIEASATIRSARSRHLPHRRSGLTPEAPFKGVMPVTRTGGARALFPASGLFWLSAANGISYSIHAPIWVIFMARKKKARVEKAIEIAPGEVKSTARETLEYWNEENMREARPISIDIDCADEKAGGPAEK